MSFRFHNNTKKPLDVCIVCANQDNVQWVWNGVAPESSTDFGFGRMYPDERMWIAIVKPDSEGVPGVDRDSSFLKMRQATVVVPNSNGSVNGIPSQIARMIKDNDWAGFAQAVGTPTREYTGFRMRAMKIYNPVDFHFKGNNRFVFRGYFYVNSGSTSAGHLAEVHISDAEKQDSEHVVVSGEIEAWCED